MKEAGTIVIPLFNWDLRTAKPILLYWLLLASNNLFGMSEWSARFPSAIMYIMSVLLTFDLARRMFDTGIGLLAGIITASTMQLCMLGHACTTDATLIAFSILYFWCFWRGTREGRPRWYIPCAIASGLATLTKGPAVGLVTLSATVGVWMWVNSRLSMLRDRRMFWACIVWGIVAIPWYALVAAESHGQWPREFFLYDNLGRATSAIEKHYGVPVLYEFVVICLLFAPWSVFLYATLRNSIREFRTESHHRQAYQLLLIWLGVYFVACSAALTKLPHYIAPAYPALAILTAVFLMRWVRGEINPPRWVIPTGTFGIYATGLIFVLLFVIFGGAIVVNKHLPRYPEFVSWTWIGGILLLGGIGMTLGLRLKNRCLWLNALSISIVCFVGCLSAFPLTVLENYKAPRKLVELSGTRQLDREIFLASFEYSQPSLVYYAQRRVERMGSATETARWLERKVPSFLYVPEDVWMNEVLPELRCECRIVAEHYDFYRDKKIYVIANRY
jgi:4-amino-4-deoxy-L-arabinose transferase-like glycosyltransferase